MASLLISKRQWIANAKLLVFCGVIFSFVAACGDNKATTGGSAGDASASFNIHWNPDPTQSAGLSTLSLNCAAQGIETVLCEIYDEQGTWLASGGPWPCSDGGGTITRIPPGPRRTFVILGLDENDQIVYQGQSAPIDLEPGDHNDAGTIEAYNFRPEQIDPPDGAQPPTGPLALTWQPVTNAVAYRVWVSADSAFAEVIVDTVTPGTTYTLDEYPAGTVCWWQIQAIDNYRNESAPSQPLRRFQTRPAPEPEPDPDLEPPVVTFTDPSGLVYWNTNTIAVWGTATDNIGVTQVSWANNRGGSGIFSGKSVWSASIPLLEGTNVITATALDAAGNTATDTLTVIYTLPDLEPPVVTFTDPFGQVNTTGNTITVFGTASDNVGVTRVSWRNDRGGSGVFTGTTEWSGNIPLLEGTNVITATARDAAGNKATDTLTVIYTIRWQKTFEGAGKAFSVQIEPEGGYIVAGTGPCKDSSDYCAFLLKVTSQGVIEWYYEYLPAGYNASSGYSVQVTAEGDYLLAGDATIYNTEQTFAHVVKTRKNGTVLNQKIYTTIEGEDTAYCIQLAENGYIAVGSANWRGYSLKIDPTLELELEWPVFSETGESFKAVQVFSNGYVIAGRSYVGENGYESFLLNTRVDGIQRWSFPFGNTSWEERANAVLISPEENYYIVAGNTTEGGTVNAYLKKIYDLENRWVDPYWGGIYNYMEENSEGTYTVATSTVANALHAHDDGYIIAGTVLFEGSSYAYLAKFDLNGAFEWAEKFGIIGTNSSANSLQVTQDNGFIISGSSRLVGSVAPSDVYLIKTDAKGKLE
jgi:hypothetical protein